MFRLNEMTKLEFVNKMNDIQNKNATKLILNQNRVNQAVMNFEKGNIGVKDGLAIHREGLYKLPDLVNVSIELFASSTVPPFFKIFPISSLVL
jgi:hypothetical protein